MRQRDKRRIVVDRERAERQKQGCMEREEKEKPAYKRKDRKTNGNIRKTDGQRGTRAPIHDPRHPTTTTTEPPLTHRRDVSRIT
jgi:hypothetical protein